MNCRGAFVMLGLACTACGGGVSTADPAAPIAAPESAPDVSAILAKMTARYRSAKTYADVGTFRDVSHPGTDRESVTTASFRTKWVAPDRLLFDLRIDRTQYFDPDRLVVWTPTKGAIKRLFLGKIEDRPSLSDALYAFQGVTHGLTGLTPRWLVTGFATTATYEAGGTVACGSATCIELSAKLRENQRVTLSIDVATGALRKYVSSGTIAPRPLTPDMLEMLERMPPGKREALAQRALEPFEVQHTILFEPTFDAPIDESAFAFDPAAAIAETK